MFKNFIFSSLIFSGILFSKTLAHDSATDEKTAAHPLSAFYKSTSDGRINLTIDGEKIDQFLELTEHDNSFKAVNTLTLTGSWTPKNINRGLRTLFSDRVRHIDEALIRKNIIIRIEDLFVFNSLIPFRTRVVKDHFEEVSGESHFRAEELIERCFSYLPPDLVEYEIGGIPVPLTKLKGLPKNLVSFAIIPLREPFWFFDEAHKHYPTSLRALKVYNFGFDMRRLLPYLQNTPRSITSISVVNHSESITYKYLNQIICALHEDIEYLDFSCDFPKQWQYGNRHFERSGDTDILDLTRLPRLRALKLDGLGFPSTTRSKSDSVLVSVEISRNPVVRAVFDGVDVSVEALRNLPRNLLAKLKQMLAQIEDTQSEKPHIATTTLENLQQVYNFHEHPALETQLYEILRARGVNVDSILIGQWHLKAAEQLESMFGSEPGYITESDMSLRDSHIQKASDYGVKRQGDPFASPIIEQQYLKMAKTKKESREKYAQKAAIYGPDGTTIDSTLVEAEFKPRKEIDDTLKSYESEQSYLQAIENKEKQINELIVRTWPLDRIEYLLAERKALLQKAAIFGVHRSGAGALDARSLEELYLRAAMIEESDERQLLDKAAKYRSAPLVKAQPSITEAVETAATI